MSRFTRQQRAFGRGQQSGFSLIEVMIAVVILSLGLLGMALLQTTALRSGQSANHRTQAIILAYEMMDMIRANRNQAAAYTFINPGQFNGDGRTGICAPNAALPAVRWQADAIAWRCSIRRTLPGANADVVIVNAVAGAGGVPPIPGSATVTINWVDDRTVAAGAAGQMATITVQSGI